MAFRIGHRLSEGQAGFGSPGGGYLLDQITAKHGSFASTVLPLTKGIGMIPQFDTQDFAASWLSDVEPITYTPNVKVGRISLALGASQASAASNPIFSIKRSRSGTIVTMGTFNMTTQGFSAAWTPVHLTGSQISNGTLLAGDVLFVSIVSGTSGPPPIPPFIIQIDGEA